MNQTYDPIEIIVVDDSGAGHAEPVMDEYDGIRYVEFDRNQGPNAARNAGISVASGEYIQLLDDDDRLEPEKIAKQVSLFTGRPEIGVVYCAEESESFGEMHPRPDGRGDVLELALAFELPGCVTSTMLIRKSIIEDVYPLPDVPGSDDTYWKIEFARRGSFEFIDEVLVKKRNPHDRRSKSRDAVDGTWEILDRYTELYDRYDESIRQIAKSNATLREAKYLLRKQPYSVPSIRHFYRSIRIHPDPSFILYLQLVISLFGRRAYEISLRSYPYVQRYVSGL